VIGITLSLTVWLSSSPKPRPSPCRSGKTSLDISPLLQGDEKPINPPVRLLLSPVIQYRCVSSMGNP
jgi:hypothetical protein